MSDRAESEKVFLEMLMRKSLQRDADGNVVIEVEASNEGLDLEGQKVLQAALLGSKEHFLNNGVVSKDHLHRTPTPGGGYEMREEYVIGEPISVRAEGLSTIVKAKLYSGSKYAGKFIDLLDQGSTRVKASVGGLRPRIKAVMENGRKVGEIVSVLWDDLALTICPVNPSLDGATSMAKSLSSAEFVKALSSPWDEGRHSRDDGGKFAEGGRGGGGNDYGELLKACAAPMLEVEYSVENYNRLFPRGEVKTPLGTVRMGRDQFEKMGRKDGGARKSYLGAAWQTLTDPALVIGEGDDRLYIKSFAGDKGIAGFVSVEKDKDGQRVVVTNYRRDIGEIGRKLKKWAGSPLYLKEGDGPAGGTEGKPLAISDDNHLPKLSPDTAKKSSDEFGKALSAGVGTDAAAFAGGRALQRESLGSGEPDEADAIALAGALIAGDIRGMEEAEAFLARRGISEKDARALAREILRESEKHTEVPMAKTWGEIRDGLLGKSGGKPKGDKPKDEGCEGAGCGEDEGKDDDDDPEYEDAGGMVKALNEKIESVSAALEKMSEAHAMTLEKLAESEAMQKSLGEGVAFVMDALNKPAERKSAVTPAEAMMKSLSGGPKVGGMKPFDQGRIERMRPHLIKAVADGEISALTSGLWETQMNKSVGAAAFPFAPDFVEFARKKLGA
ncbi:MAG: hypothetical protein FWE09_00385 [Treponema sp.]|nr:hypothetical protein [Treponema sp.]